MDKTIREKVVEILEVEFVLEDREITLLASDETPLWENGLGLDSLEFVELISECEDKFDVEITDQDAERLRTVGDLVTFIEKQVAARTDTISSYIINS